MNKFDQNCEQINQTLETLRQWKYIYFGAAYSTRLSQLAESLRELAVFVEKTVSEDRA